MAKANKKARSGHIKNCNGIGSPIAADGGPRMILSIPPIHVNARQRT